MTAERTARGRWLLALLGSAALFALPFPPWNFSWLAWVVLVPLLWMLGSLRPAGAFGMGLLWAHGAHWAVAYWVPPALNDYYGQAWWFGTAFGLLTSPVFWMAPFAAFAGLAAWTMQRSHGVLRIAIVSCLWVTCELVRARLLGAPWMLMGYALLPTPVFIQIADIGGPYIISFVIVFVNAALVELLLGRRQRWRTHVVTCASAAALVAATYIYGRYSLSRSFTLDGMIPVSVIQGNNISAARWQPGAYGEGFDSYLRLSAQAIEEHHPRLLIWPEAAVTLFLAHETGYRRAIAQLLGERDIELITGAPHSVGSDPAQPTYLNSAFYLHADGEIAGRVDKVRLLPFAEYFPLRSIEFLRRRFEKVRIFAPGDSVPVLSTRLGDSAVVICFEAIFPELVRERMARGALLLINLSNDVWLGSGAGQEQMLAMATLRAVENRTWMIRATTTGISAVIDPTGRIVASTTSGVAAVLHADVAPLGVATIYKRWGDWFAVGCALAGVAVLIGLRPNPLAPFPRREGGVRRPRPS